MADGTWALADSLAGIHCAALKGEDFAVLAEHGASMVVAAVQPCCSTGKPPTSRPPRPPASRSAWDQTGHRAPARTCSASSRSRGSQVTRPETCSPIARSSPRRPRTAAEILKWDKALGTLEQGKRPELVVLDGTAGDPYEQLLKADERDVSLVMVDGVARYRHRSLVTTLGGKDSRPCVSAAASAS
jgi:5-methylthioadenosine/S-adenosylhomocysteine deaminase